jgi:N-sulfoglucosamine sulfohydrolase
MKNTPSIPAKAGPAGSVCTRSAVAAAVFCLSFSPAAVQADEEKTSRPNFVVFITDDESALERRAYGWSDLPTPNFERVARDGVLFKHAYCSAPSCAPARAALLTGRNFWELEQGAFIQAFLPKKFPVLPDLLAAAGYRTGYTGKAVGPYSPRATAERFGAKMGVAPNMEPAGRRYNQIEHEEPEDDGDVIDYVANFRAFLEEDKDGQPFWFWAGLIDPHSPWDPDNPRKLEEKYGIALDAVPLPGFMPDDPRWRTRRASWLYELLRADETLGRLLALLEEKGLLENTVLIVTSDNGSWYGTHGKAGAYEWGVHVPMAVQWPARVKGGRTVTDFVGFPDLAPTMLEAAGVAVPPTMSGRSLLPILLSEKSGRVDADRSFMVTGLEWHGELEPGMRASRTIRDDRYAYIVNYGQHPDHPSVKLDAWRGSGQWPAEELYDLVDDPWQLQNLAGDPAHTAARKRLQKQLTGYQRQTGDPRATGEMDIFEATRAMVLERKRSGYKDN